VNEITPPIFISRSGQRYGPYSADQCQQMVAAGQLVPLDMAWRHGMQDWRPLGELIPNAVQFSPAPVRAEVMPARSNLGQATYEGGDSVWKILGSMSFGCLIWIGVILLATGGGVVFPVLLILLPFLLIGGIIELTIRFFRLFSRKR